jgi:hypothetical protein
MAALNPYRIIEFPDGGDKRKSQFIDQADRGLAIGKFSHNLNGMTARFAGCDKKRATPFVWGLRRFRMDAEQIPSNFQTQRHALEQCIDRSPKFYVKVAGGIVADWHKLHITSQWSSTTVASVGNAVDARRRPDQVCARAKGFVPRSCG